jgi:hypothetical protein
MFSCFIQLVIRPFWADSYSAADHLFTKQLLCQSYAGVDGKGSGTFLGRGFEG